MVLILQNIDLAAPDFTKQARTVDKVGNHLSPDLEVHSGINNCELDYHEANKNYRKKYPPAIF